MNVWLRVKGGKMITIEECIAQRKNKTEIMNLTLADVIEILVYFLFFYTKLIKNHILLP